MIEQLVQNLDSLTGQLTSAPLVDPISSNQVNPISNALVNPISTPITDPISDSLVDPKTEAQISQVPVIEIDPADDEFTAGPDGEPDVDTIVNFGLNASGIDFVVDTNVETDGFDANYLFDLSDIIPDFPVSGFTAGLVSTGLSAPFSPNGFLVWETLLNGLVNTVTLPTFGSR